MKVVLVTAFYSAGMGYTENCLPRALAALGHEVHVIASTLNVYGTSPDYDKTYSAFLGPAEQGRRSFDVDGYTVHRLDHRLVSGYVAIKGLSRKVRQLAPQVVHCTEIASLNAYVLAAMKPFGGFKLFTESHQHLSVVRPYLREPGGHFLRRGAYWLTRTLPTSLASLAAERCYAIAPDCVHVANRFYGVPLRKLKLQSLGTDTQLFHPASTPEEFVRRTDMRTELRLPGDAVIFVYTGRLTADKNPLLLAQAVGRLSAGNPRFHSLFVGEGPQKEEILRCSQATVLPFMRHSELARVYRMADVAVWPRQESMSMLDAAASGLPLVVSSAMGESERVSGNGILYVENSVEDLERALLSLAEEGTRRALGSHGRAKMIEKFSWTAIASAVADDYSAALAS